MIKNEGINGPTRRHFNDIVKRNGHITGVDTPRFRNGVWTLWEDTQNERAKLPKISTYGVEELKILTRTSIDMATAFSDTTRDSGAPYFDEHLLGVAEILIHKFGRVKLDLIIAALLHDYIEDKATIDALKALFNATRYGVNVHKLAPNIQDIFEHVPDMVNALSKAGGLGKSKKVVEAEVLRRLIAAIIKYGYGIGQVKLADRLHNMRTIGPFAQKKPERALEKADETEQVYMPLAHMMAHTDVEQELFDICLNLHNPAAFRQFRNERQERRVARVSDFEDDLLGMIDKVAFPIGLKIVPDRAMRAIGRGRRIRTITPDNLDIPRDSLLHSFVITTARKDVENAVGIVVGLLARKTTRVTIDPSPEGVLPREGTHIQFRDRHFGVLNVRVNDIPTEALRRRGRVPVAEDDLPHDDRERMRGALDRTIGDHRDIYAELIEIFSPPIKIRTPKEKVVEMPRGAVMADFAGWVHPAALASMVSAEVTDSDGETKWSEDPLAELTDDTQVTIMRSDARIGSAASKVRPWWLEYVRTLKGRVGIHKQLNNLSERDKERNGVEYCELVENLTGLSKASIIGLVKARYQNLKTYSDAMIFQRIGKGELSLVDIVMPLRESAEPWSIMVTLPNQTGILKDVILDEMKRQNVNLLYGESIVNKDGTATQPLTLMPSSAMNTRQLLLILMRLSQHCKINVQIFTDIPQPPRSSPLELLEGFEGGAGI